MGTCKKCNEVFGVMDLNNGYCKNCFDPSLVDKEINSQSVKAKVDTSLKGFILSVGSTVLNIIVVLAMLGIVVNGLSHGNIFSIIFGVLGVAFVSFFAYLIIDIRDQLIESNKILQDILLQK